jgi:hypothetical protein
LRPREAIQHQFPTKARLMVAVVEAFSIEQSHIYMAAIRRGASPREKLENLIDANLDLVGSPYAAAALEVHLARRNDPELERRWSLSRGVSTGACCARAAASCAPLASTMKRRRGACRC